jgi:hypothetical protein
VAVDVAIRAAQATYVAAEQQAATLEQITITNSRAKNLHAPYSKG